MGNTYRRSKQQREVVTNVREPVVQAVLPKVVFPRVVRNRVEGRYDPVRFNRASHDAFRVYPRAFSVLPEKCQ